MLRVVTLNTWKCEGDYRARLPRMAAGLRALDADLVCLQEVFACAAPSADTAAWLADALGLSAPLYAGHSAGGLAALVAATGGEEVTWDDSALPDGMLTDTAPSVGIQYCGVGWAMAHPHLQTQLYRYYGDRRIVEEQYATSRRWLELVRAANPDHIVKNGLHDHEALEKEKSPPMVTPPIGAPALVSLGQASGPMRQSWKTLPTKRPSVVMM